MLPGTGGLTRVTDKRKVRRDLADVFCTTEEGVKGKRAVDWRLVDEKSRAAEDVHAFAGDLLAEPGRGDLYRGGGAQVEPAAGGDAL